MESLETNSCNNSCSTRSHYVRHVQKGETPCDNSRKARLEYARKYRETNTEVYRAGQIRYYQANKELFYLKNKKFREDNPEHVRDYHREWSKKHPNSQAESSRKRRALKRKNGHVKYTTQDALALYGTDCFICKLPIDLEAPKRVGVAGWEKGLHIDHLIPLSKGGPDTLENVRPTHGICNTKKHNSITEVREES